MKIGDKNYVDDSNKVCFVCSANQRTGFYMKGISVIKEEFRP